MEENPSEERLRKKQERTELYKGKLSRSKPLYDNCQLLTKEGKLIATCSEKTLKVCAFCCSLFVLGGGGCAVDKEESLLFVC